MLRLNNIQVIYSDVILVLKGLSLEVAAGQIVALLGANGAGKTTTLKAISGLLKTEDGRVTDGSIEFMGRRIDGLDPEDICRRGIVQVMEGRKVLETLTVEENLRIGGYTRRDADGIQQDLKMIYEYFPILVTRRHQVAGYLSGGEQQMLVIGRALMARPKLCCWTSRHWVSRRSWCARSSTSSARSTRSGGRRSCSSSRTPRWPCASRITATSWRTAGSSSTVRPPSCAATTTCGSSTSGSARLDGARASRT